MADSLRAVVHSVVNGKHSFRGEPTLVFALLLQNGE